MGMVGVTFYFGTGLAVWCKLYDDDQHHRRCFIRDRDAGDRLTR